MPSSTPELRDSVRQTILRELMLDLDPSEIADETPLFGPGGPGLDSVDALQLAVALDKSYGLKLTDQDEAKRVMRSVKTIAEAVADSGGQGADE